MLWPAIYFAAGVVEDILASQYYLAVGRRRAFLASLLAVAITALALFLLERLIVMRDIFLVLAYGLGNGVGTYASVKYGARHE